MLVIRFLRVGKRNQPAFKIVVTDKRKPPQSGKFIEQVGFYSPLTKEKILKKDKIKYWMSVGAKPSATVYNLLVEEKILEGEKTPVHKKAKKEKPSTGAELDAGPVPHRNKVSGAGESKEKPAPEEKKEGKPVKEVKVEKKSEEKIEKK